MQHLLRISHYAWSDVLPQPINQEQSRSDGILKKIPSTFQVPTVASFSRTYLFPGKVRYRCEREYPAVEFIILRCSLSDFFINFQLRFRMVSQDYVTESKNHLTLSGPAFSVVRQARGGLRGPDAKNQG